MKLSKCIFAALATSAISGTPVFAQDVNLCAGLTTHVDSVSIPQIRKPEHMRYFKDPAFNTLNIRITDAAEGEVWKPPYSTMQAWNADESLMILYRTGLKDKGHYILDGHTYEILEKPDISPADLEEVYWSHSDPNIFYYSSKFSKELGHFYEWNVSKSSKRLIKDFSNVCGGGKAVGGKGVHMQSLNDDLFAFRCRDMSEGRKAPKKFKMFTYQISTDTIVEMPLGEGTPWHNWAAPSPTPSGKYLWMQGHTIKKDLKTIVHKHDMGNAREHANVGRTHDGQDAIYQVVFNASPNGCDGDKYKGIGHATEFNLETGECRSLIGEEKGYPYTTSATHVSAQAYKAPGWIALSSIGLNTQMDLMKSGKKVPPLLSEIYMANADPDNEVVCRLAHHRSTGKLAENGSYRAYFGEPHVTMSPSGTRLLYGSDWYDSGSVDSYVLELPSYKRPSYLNK